MKHLLIGLTLSGMVLGTTTNAQNWTTTGNAGTSGGTNFVGTTDLHPLLFKTNAQERMRIDSTNGFVGIGTPAPTFRLSLAGTASLAQQTIGINGTPVVYLPDQSSSLAWSVAYGTGLRNLVPSTVISNQGSGNTAVGIHSMDAVTTGIDNTAVGRHSLSNNISGVANTAIGANTLLSVSSGGRNIGLGFNAMQTVTTGWDNIGIGAFSSSIGPSAGTLSNTAAIGFNAKVGKSNAMSFGDTTKPTLVGMGTAYPDYQLDVRAAANPLRLKGLQAGDPTDYIVTANSDGVLRQVPASSIGGSVSADQGLTMDGSTVQLGDGCSKGGGKFKENREINMADQNLYFNSSEKGKLYMGAESCKKLVTRLEIGAKGLPYVNGYDPSRPSPSGLRFTDLTAKDDPIKNKTKGVLSLDEDGDVIWVEACCESSGEKPAASSEEMDNLKETVKDLQSQIDELKALLRVQLQGSQDAGWKIDGTTNTLFQNVPNPSDKTTRIEYTLNRECKDVYIAIYDLQGKTLSRMQLKAVAGKGAVQADIAGLAAGSYPYALFVNGVKLDAKIMQIVR